jgi:hypothetical protein
MSVRSVAPTLFAPDLSDITHACDNCGSELVRTVKATNRTLPVGPVAAKSDGTRAA